MADHGTREILEERARELARPLDVEEEGDALSLMVLLVGAERYGVDIARVEETRPLVGLTALPHAPPFWKGLVNVRGRLCPVLDLGRYLQVPTSRTGRSEDQPEGMLVVVSGDVLTVGLLVDGLGEIRRVSMSDVKASPAEPAGGGARAMLGMTDDLISVLSVEAMLADPGLTVQGG